MALSAKLIRILWLSDTNCWIDNCQTLMRDGDEDCITSGECMKG